MEALLYIIWVVTSCLLAWRLATPSKVYAASALAFSVPCFYTQHVHGFLEMGGLFHIACAGVYPVGLFYIRRLFKRRSVIRTSVRQNRH
ncbi:MAG: hypothetical protein JWM04_31 [Verrucomicrobiales bacterium]|nr:hypothetical protein [Verrucomicrobiales bacterium]